MVLYGSTTIDLRETKNRKEKEREKLKKEK
jgi:hypothetical protein